MDLKKIWKNRKQIYEGIKNSVMRDDFVEDVSAKRMAICKECLEINLDGSKIYNFCGSIEKDCSSVD